MAEKTYTPDDKRIVPFPNDGTPLPVTMTDTEFSTWLESDLSTLAAVKEPVEQKPVKDPKVLQLETASAAGDLTRVKALFDQWHSKPTKDEQINLDPFASCFGPVIRNGHASVAASMLDSRITIMNEAHFRLAVKHKAYAIMELCLSRGFDINTSFTSTWPASLADTFDDTGFMR
ncbi:MAG: hypothetical protein Q9169_006668 [Polycauliona sp. 2 TL-2023]